MKKGKGIPKEQYEFDTATIKGNCCWKVWNRYRGGKSLDMPTVNVYETRWVIRAIKEVKNCNFN